MAAPGQQQQLAALAATDVQDSLTGAASQVIGQLPGHQVLADNLAERPQASAPLSLPRRERVGHRIPPSPVPGRQPGTRRGRQLPSSPASNAST